MAATVQPPSNLQDFSLHEARQSSRRWAEQAEQSGRQALTHDAIVIVLGELLTSGGDYDHDTIHIEVGRNLRARDEFQRDAESRAQGARWARSQGR